MAGTKRFQFALACRPAAHIAGRDGALLAQEDGAAGERLLVLRVPYLESGNRSESSAHASSISKSKAAAEYRTYYTPSKVSPNSKCQQPHRSVPQMRSLAV